MLLSKKKIEMLKAMGINVSETTSTNVYKDAWKRLRRNTAAMISLAVIVIIILAAIFAPIIAPEDPYAQTLSQKLDDPSSEHVLGTDHLGRDILSRIIYGARISLLVGVVCEAISVPIGVILGALAGYYGGKTDMVISRMIEIFASFPFILFAIAIMFILGSGILNVFIAIGIIGWTGHARIIRSQVMQLKNKEFVEAARAAGASDMKIIFKHLLPNCISTIIVVTTIDIPGDIMLESTLSFVGLGVQPPMASWGSMINDARMYMRQAPLYSLWPGIALMILVLALNTLGDGLRDALDPRLKNL